MIKPMIKTGIKILKDYCANRSLVLVVTTALVGAAIMPVVTAPPAHGGGYSSLKKEYNDYTGQQYLIESIEPAPAREPSETIPAADRADAFKAVRDNLAARKAEGLRGLEREVYDSGIFEPDPSLWVKAQEAREAGDLERLLTEDFSIETVLAVGLKNNPDVRKAYNHARAALEKYDQAANLDDILGQYSAFTKDLDIGPGKPHHNKPVMMSFPHPAMLALKGSIIDHEVRIARLKLRAAAQDVITRLRSSYYESAYLYHAVAITSETLALLRRLKGAVNSVYTTGRSTLNDVIKLQIEIDRLVTKIEGLEQKRESVQVRINEILDVSMGFMPSETPVLEPITLEYETEGLVAAGAEFRVEIGIATADIEKTGLMIQMAEKRFYPDFTPGYSIFQNRTITQTTTAAASPAFGIRPMVRGSTWFGTNDAYIREARSKYLAKKDHLASLLNRTADGIFHAVYLYEDAARLGSLYSTKLIPQSRLTIEITETMYVTGKVDYMDLISSQQMHLRFSLLHKKSIMDMNTQAAVIERLTGVKAKVRAR